MDPIEVPCEQSSQSKNIDDALTTKREDSSNGLTRIELNCRQATCLLRRLPKCYSLQVDSKPVRRVPTAARNKDKDK